MKAKKKSLFGILIMGTLVGAILGAAIADSLFWDYENQLYATIVGSCLGVVAGVVVELAYVRNLISAKTMVVVFIILILVALVMHPVRPPHPR